MDKFVTVLKPSAKTLAAGEGTGGKQPSKKPKAPYRYNPYSDKKANERQPGDFGEKRRIENLLAPLVKSGVKQTDAVLRRHLLSTLSDESNPVTHSDIYSRTDHVTSMATGHQRSDGRGNQRPYLDTRRKKLNDQRPEQESSVGANVLHGVRIYIGGYLDNSTDIEMKRIVSLAGGQILYTASGATHILTSQQLSGSKTQKLLTGKSRGIVHVVRPQWVTESIEAGKRLPERTYSVLKNNAVADVSGLLQTGSSSIPRAQD